MHELVDMQTILSIFIYPPPLFHDYVLVVNLELGAALHKPWTVYHTSEVGGLPRTPQRQTADKGQGNVALGSRGTSHTDTCKIKEVSVKNIWEDCQ